MEMEKLITKKQFVIKVVYTVMAGMIVMSQVNHGDVKGELIVFSTENFI